MTTPSTAGKAGERYFTWTPGFGEDSEIWDGFSGAGMVDTVAGIIKSNEEHNAGAIAAYGVGLAFDVVGAMLNPLGALLAAGVGWLIDHVKFLREPLDLLMGDNLAVRFETAKMTGDVAGYPAIATAHLDALKKLENWTGEAADAFKRSMAKLGDELEATGMAIKGAAEMMSKMSACVTAFRSLVRDIIAMVIGNMAAGAIVAAGLAPFTFGASVVAFVGVAVATALEALGRIVRHIANLKSLLTANKTAGDQIGKALAKIGDDASRFGRSGGGGTAPRGGPSVAPPPGRSPDVTGTSGAPAPKPTEPPPPPAQVTKPPDVPGTQGSPGTTTAAGGPNAVKPPDPKPAPNSGAPPKSNWQYVHDMGVKIRQGRKEGMDALAKVGTNKIEGKLVAPPYNKTPQEAADIARWIKNFANVAAPGGKVIIAGKPVPTGNALHLAHELWKEFEGE